MAKSHDRNLKGKIKIKRKPHPIGNEFKTMCDGRSKIVMYIKLHDGKVFIVKKDLVKELGEATAICLCLTDKSIMLIKTARDISLERLNFPEENRYQPVQKWKMST